MVQTIRILSFASVAYMPVFGPVRLCGGLRFPSVDRIRSGKFALEPPTSGPKTTAHSTEGMQLALRLALPGAMWVF
jgi:hypothetical protein